MSISSTRAPKKKTFGHQLKFTLYVDEKEIWCRVSDNRVSNFQAAGF